MICTSCQKHTEWIDNIGQCEECNLKEWADWEIEHKDELDKIDKLSKTHTHHCACRQVWGDGECECGGTDGLD